MGPVGFGKKWIRAGAGSDRVGFFLGLNATLLRLQVTMGNCDFFVLVETVTVFAVCYWLSSVMCLVTFTQSSNQQPLQKLPTSVRDLNGNGV